MSKNDGFNETQLLLIEDLVDNKVCASKAEARRIILSMPEEIIRHKISKVKIRKLQRSS